MTEEAYILFVRKNALQVLIPKYGIEGNIFLREVTSRSKFDDEVRCRTGRKQESCVKSATFSVYRTKIVSSLL